MKKWFVLSLFLFILSGCENNQSKELSYDGQSLHIAVIGEIPEIENESIKFESITLNEFNTKVNSISNDFDAMMITPNMFVEASQDQYSEAYRNVQSPIIFWNSKMAHYPFVNNKINYLNENEVSLNNSNSPHSFDIGKPHSAVYLYDIESEMENVWYFHLNEKKDLQKLYEEIFNTIEQVTL